MLGDVKAGHPPAPQMLCVTNEAPGLAGPPIDAAGAQAWWEEPDGIWAMGVGADCQQPSLVVPGASEPDWSAAAVNPGPAAKPKAKKKKRRQKRKRAHHG